MRRHLCGLRNVAPGKLDEQIDQATGKKDAEMIDTPIDEDSYCSFSNGIERPLSKLCFNCQNIFSHWEEILIADGGHLPHCDDERAFRASADAGCGLCTQFMLGSSEITPYYSSLYTDEFVDDGDDGNDRLLKGFVWLQAGDKLSRNGRKVFWQIKLILPFLRGYDEEYDEWDEDEPLSVEYVVNLIPAHRQGWSQLHLSIIISS
jgi:hypothetical protein